jgi:hypothetical protein
MDATLSTVNDLSKLNELQEVVNDCSSLPPSSDPAHSSVTIESATDTNDLKKRKSAHEDYESWKVGDLDPRNEKIKNICGQRDTFIVYFVQGGWLNWFFDAKKIAGAHMLEATAQILLNQGRSWIRDKREFGEFRNVVAAAMVHGLSNLEVGKPYEECFKNADEHLKVRSKSTYRITFVLSAVASALLIGGIFFTLATLDNLVTSQLHRHLFLGGAAGAYGALLSMLIRASKLEPESFSHDSKPYVILESAIRILLGVSFGFILVLLQKAGVLLQIAGDNTYFVALGSIIAGFNERLIPALLADMEGLYGINKSKTDTVRDMPLQQV